MSRPVMMPSSLRLASTTKLFEEEKDCIELIKIKEIMHELEKTTDAAEHVGKILKSLIVKYA